MGKEGARSISSLLPPFALCLRPRGDAPFSTGKKLIQKQRPVRQRITTPKRVGFYFALKIRTTRKI